jgi:hypothetical protein
MSDIEISGPGRLDNLHRYATLAETHRREYAA